MKFNVYFKKYPYEVLLITLTFLVQSVVFVLIYFFGAGGFMWLSDSVSYLEIAKNLITHHGFFVNIEWGPQTFRTPLYPLFIALFYGLIPKVWFIILIQNIIAVVNILLTYKLGKLIFNSKVAFLGALFLIFESSRLVFASQLMSETLFVFFILLAVYFFVKFIGGAEKLYLIISAISIGLAALTRPVIQFFPFGIILFLIILGIARKNIKKCLLSALLFLTVFAVTISPWLIRNYVHFGKWELSSLGGYNLYVIASGRFLEYQLGYEEKNIDAIHVLNVRLLKHFNLDWSNNDPDWTLKSTRLMEPQYEDYLLAESRKIISSDISLYVWIHARRMITFFIESSASRSWGAILYGLNLPSKIFYPFLYFGGRTLWILFDLIILIAFILFFSTFKKKIWDNIFLIGTIFYFAILSSLHSDIGRFRQPIEPFLFLFLANGIILFYYKIISNRKNIFKGQ